jgi:hypothetical protein
LGSDVDAAVVNAVKEWRFIPAQLEGEAQQVTYNVTVTVGAK